MAVVVRVCVLMFVFFRAGGWAQSSLSLLEKIRSGSSFLD